MFFKALVITPPGPCYFLGYRRLFCMDGNTISSRTNCENVGRETGTWPIAQLPAQGRDSGYSAREQVRRYSGLVLLLVVFLAGCTLDPNARKQKYLHSGDRYFAEKKYREAIIEYSNALKIDPHFTAAHYGIAKTYMQIGSWPNARVELTATVEAEPDNLEAQLDLGNLLLAGHDLPGARGKAELVLAKSPQKPEAHVLLANVYAGE